MADGPMLTNGHRVLSFSVQQPWYVAFLDKIYIWFKTSDGNHCHYVPNRPSSIKIADNVANENVNISCSAGNYWNWKIV
jgi:hypothetical protein